jgi:long-chain acyl-CoA synthetase
MEGNGYIDYLHQAIEANTTKTAFSDYQGESYTFGEVGEWIMKHHQLFKELDIHKGDRIALVGRNMSAWAISYLSVVSYGAVVVPILPDFSANDIQHIVNHSGAVLLFATDLAKRQDRPRKDAAH